MTEFGVLCTMGDGDKTLITIPATDADAALAEVRRHRTIFDGAPSSRPSRRIVEIHEVKEIAAWDE